MGEREASEYDLEYSFSAPVASLHSVQSVNEDQLDCEKFLLSASDKSAGEINAPRETRRKRDARGHTFQRSPSVRVLRFSRGAYFACSLVCLSQSKGDFEDAINTIAYTN